MKKFLMDQESAQLILAGKKTQVRLPYKPKNGFPKQDGEITPTSSHTWTEWGPCPFGAEGDKLWVPEQWRTCKVFDKQTPNQIAADCIEAGWTSPWAPLEYRDGTRQAWGETFQQDEAGKWRQAVSMPQWAARLFVEITALRVEMLQAITEDDAKAEGITMEDVLKEKVPSARDVFRYRYKDAQGTWDNYRRVWVITFKRIFNP